mgnify:CR=1 FL=1
MKAPIEPTAFSETMAARPVAAELMLRTGETVMLATLDERSAEALYLDVVDSQQDIRYSPRVGSRWPLYCTGMGRALLAFQEPVFVDRYLASARTVERTELTGADGEKLIYNITLDLGGKPNNSEPIPGQQAG